MKDHTAFYGIGWKALSSCCHAARDNPGPDQKPAHNFKLINFFFLVDFIMGGGVMKKKRCKRFFSIAKLPKKTKKKNRKNEIFELRNFQRENRSSSKQNEVGSYHSFQGIQWRFHQLQKRFFTRLIFPTPPPTIEVPSS